MKRLIIAAFFLLITSFPCMAASEGWVVASCPASLSTAYTIPGYAAISIDQNGNACISGSLTATLSGFTPGGTFATLTATNAAGTVALPAGTVVAFQNTGTTTVSCTVNTGSAAVANEIQVPASSTVFITVGANTSGSCIDQTGSTSNLVVLAGGSGLGTGFGGGGGGSGGATNITQTAGTAINATIAATGALPVDVLTTGNLYTAATAPLPVIAGTLPSTQTPVTTGTTTKAQSDLNGNLYVNPVSQYPAGSTPITASATGTTAATTATLTGTSTTTVYICGYSIRANATAAATVTDTVTGVITATLSSILWVAPLASGIGVDEQIFNPCIPASGTNQAIAIVSGAPGSGGTVSSKGWGYYK